MTTTPDEVPATRTLTIHREVVAVVAMTVGAQAALVDTGSEPTPADARVVLEIVDQHGRAYAFELDLPDVDPICNRLVIAQQDAIALGNQYS